MSKPPFEEVSSPYLETQVLVVGGGPAGISAALELDALGISVILIDENAELGGQYFRQRSEYIVRLAGDFRQTGRALVKAIKESEVIVLTSNYIFAIDDAGKHFYVFNETNSQVMKLSCDYLIIATGSQELVIPYRGWQIPKCVTPGMASRIFDIDYINPDQSIVIAGSGPFLLSVAAHIVERGVKVKAVIDCHNPSQLRFSTIFAALFPTRVLEFLRYRLILRRFKVPVYANFQISKAEEANSRIQSSFKSTKNTSELTFCTDYLAVAYGFQPTVELQALLDIELDTTGHTRTTKTSLSGMTNKDWVFVIGESVNIQGWRSAQIRGKLAAHKIGSRLSNVSLGKQVQNFKTVVQALYEAAFAKIRISAYQERLPIEFYEDDSLMVCRCESVTYGDIREYFDQPWSTASGLKAESRVGMGTCQGKQCGYALGQACAKFTQSNPDNFTNVRMPLRPVPISAIIQLPDKTSLAEH